MINHFKEKQKRSPWRTLAVAGLGLLIIAVLFGLMVADDRIYQKKKQLNAQLESLEQKVKQMQEKNDNLKEGISESDNPEYIEKVAREELDLQQPGETVVSFIEPELQEVLKEAAQPNLVEQLVGAVGNALNLFKK